MRERTKTEIGRLNVLAADDQETTDTPDDEMANDMPLLAQKEQIPDSAKIRWIALVLCCLSYLGNYFSWGLIANLQTEIKLKFGIDTSDINLISSISTVPTIISPFIGGILVDRFGMRKCYLVSGVVVIIGYVTVALGVYFEVYPLIVIGMAVVTCGDGPFSICNNSMLVKWFAGKELSLALGVSLASTRLGSTACCFFAPEIYKWTEKLWAPFGVGLIVNMISFVATVALVIIDQKTDTKADKEKPVEAKDAEHVGLKDLNKFQVIFFLIAVNLGIMQAGFFGFMGNVNDILFERFGFDTLQSGKLVMIIYLSPVIFTPLTGILTDKYGKRVLIILISGIVFFATHLYIAFLEDVDKSKGETQMWITVGLFFTGLFYSVYSAIIWPCIPLVVPEKLSGLGYALCSSFTAILGVGYPILLGFIKNHTEYKHGYFWTQITLSVFVGIGVAITVFLYLIDFKTGRRLHSAGTKRKLTVRERIYSHAKLNN